MIDNSTFNEAMKEFKHKENRADFFSLACNLVEKEFEVEGYLLILTTWNFAKFRYAVKEFDVESFKKTLSGLNVYFEKLKDEHFESINFENYKHEIVTIYDTLSATKGIEFTGAPKIMHLKNPRLFVMWDGYIRGEKPRKYYEQLDLFKNRDLTYKRYGKDPESYLRFLKDMQNKFKHIRIDDPEKSMAKGVDEFNYVKITLPIQDLEKKNRENEKGNERKSR